MTQEFINRLFAAMLGKCEHKHFGWSPTENKWMCSACNAYFDVLPLVWSPSLDGEITKEVRDWFAKEMPEWWEKYLKYVGEAFRFQNFSNNETGVLDAQLSITNLAQYIVDNYQEMPEEIQKRLKDGGIVE